MSKYFNNQNSKLQGYKQWETDRAKRVEISDSYEGTGIPSAARMKVTYNDDKFNEKKKRTMDGGSSKWRTEAVEKLSSKKYGRKYQDRLNKLMDEAGIPQTERNAFGKWMDANEAGVSNNSVKGYKAREIKPVEKQWANELLPKQPVTAEHKRRAGQITEAGKKADAAKSEGSILNKLLGGAKKVGSELSRFDDIATNAMTFGAKAESEKRIQKRLDKGGSSANLTEYLKPRADGNIAGKGVDMLASLAGMTVPAIGATGLLRGVGATGKGINALTQAHKAGTVTKPLLKRAALDSLKEGALVGGAIALPESAVRLGLNKESNTTLKDEAKHVAMNVALGAALDPLLTVGAPAMKMASRNAVDKAIGHRASRDVIKGLGDAHSNPTKAGELIQEQMRQGSDSIEGIAGRSDADRVLKLLTDGQVDSAKRASAFKINNPEADQARQVMQILSDTKARKITNMDAEESLAQLIGRERSKLPTIEPNRTVPTPDNPKVNASDSVPIPPNKPTHDENVLLGNAIRERDLLANKPVRTAQEEEELGLWTRHVARLEVQDQYRLSVPASDASNPELQKLLAQRAEYTNGRFFNPSDEAAVVKIDSAIKDILAKEKEFVASSPAPDVDPDFVPLVRAENAPPKADPSTPANPFNVFARPEQPKASNPFDELVNPNPVRDPVPVSEVDLNRSFIDRNIYEPKEDTRTALTKVQQTLTNDAAGLKQIDEDMKQLDVDGMMEYLNPKTWIKARKKQLATNSSLEKSALNAKGAHSVAANHTTQRFSPFLERINKSKTTSTKELGDYAFAKHGIKILEDSADSRAVRDGLLEDLDRLKAVEGHNVEEVKLIESMLESTESYKLVEGATPDVLQGQIAKFEQNPELTAHYDEFMELQRTNLKDMHDGGLIGKELYDKLMSNDTYISMTRNFGSGDNFSGSASRRPKTPLERMKGGSEARIKDPVLSAIRNTYETRFNIEKNKALAPIEKFAKIDTESVMFRGVKMPNANTITMFKNGKPKHYEVPPALKNYVDNFNVNNDPDVLTNTLQGLAQMQRKLTTQYNLSFQLKSLVREPVQAIMTSRTAKTSAHAAKNVAVGYVDALVGPQLQNLTKGLPKPLQFQSFKSNWDEMGGTGFQFIRMSDDDLQRVATEMMETGTTKGNVKKLNPFRALGKFGEKVEEGARLGEFRSAKGQGYSDKDAFFEATDITNYKRSGKLTREANKYMPFLNATIQGNSRVARAFQEAPAKTIARGATMLSTTSAAVYGMRYMDGVSDEQRQELENLNQWEKDMYVHIPVPFENNETIIAIPKAFAVGQMFMNPVERALDDYTNSTLKEESVPEHVKAGIKSTLKSFIPPYEVAGATTAYELKQNKSLFTGQEIESQYDRDAGVEKKDIEAYNQSYLTHLLSELINGMTFSMDSGGIVSPAQMDYIVKDLLGSTGTHALEASDLARTDNAPTKTWQDQLLKPINQFKADPTRASGVYDPLKKLARTEKTGNNSMSKMSKEEKAAEKASRPLQNRETEFKELNKELQAVRNDSSLSAEQKKNRIILIRKQQDELGSKTIDWYNSMD